MTISTAYPRFSDSPFFSLILRPCADTVAINMQSLTPIYYTSALTKTLPILKKQLPSIFESKCFNDGNLTFEDEAKDTEIAHLFEHILLEYLCKAKVRSGAHEAIFNGETRWDWVKDPKGCFHIYLDVAFKDTYIFKHALKK